MKKTILLVTCLFATSLAAQERGLFTEKQKAAIREEVRAQFQGLIEAAKSLDADRYLSYFDQKDFTGLGADGTVTHSYREFAAQYRQSLPLFDNYEYLEFFKVKITVLNRTTAILVNEFQADIQPKSGPLISLNGGGSQVWCRKRGVWKLVNVASATAKP